MRTFVFISFLLFICGCKKDVKDQDVFSNLQLSPKQVAADGQSTISVSVEVNEKASADRRNFVFSTTAGSFTTSGSNKQTVKAEYENGKLMAKAVLRAPFSAGKIIVSVSPEFDSPVRDFMLTDSATAIASAPSVIDLETSALGIGSNFINEVFLTAILKNTDGKNVSKGVPVLLEDELQFTQPAGGRFRNLMTATADSSKITAYYGAPALPIGTVIKIRSTVLDSNGQKTNIKDSVFITINQ